MSTGAVRASTHGALPKTPTAARGRNDSFGSHRAVETRVVPAAVSEVLREPGRPLDETIRATMERRFAYDFSSVRIHTDGSAARAARSVGADAFTVGKHVAFGAGRDDVTSVRGIARLAHELTHVAQQESKGDVSAATLAQPDSAEQVAQRNASAFDVATAPMEIGRAIASPVVQCVDDPAALNVDRDRHAEAYDAYYTHVSAEAMQKFHEIGRLIMSAARHRISACVSQYEGDLKAPKAQPFASMLAVGESQTEGLPWPKTAAGGALKALGLDLVPEILDTVLENDSTKDAESKAQSTAAEIESQLTTDSNQYRTFENSILSTLDPDFEALYATQKDNMTALLAGVRMLSVRVRAEFGAASKPGQDLMTSFDRIVDAALERLASELEQAAKPNKRRKTWRNAGQAVMGLGALGAAVAAGSDDPTIAAWSDKLFGTDEDTNNTTRALKAGSITGATLGLGALAVGGIAWLLRK